MRKLVVAASMMVLAFGAFADFAGTYTSFERQSPGASGSDGLIFRDDESGDGNSHWYSADPSSDNSAVQAYADQDTPKYTYNNGDNKRLASFPAEETSGANTPGANYLDIDASSKPLYRTLNGQSGEWPEGVTIGSGLVVDTLVQFTASEEDAVPDLASENAKVAVWLFARDYSAATGEQEEILGQTNLVVTAGSLAADAPVATNFIVKVSGEAIDYVKPNTWHRVTLRAIQDIGDGSRHRGDGVAGFALFIDGKAVTCDGVDADYDAKIGADNSLRGFLKGDPAKLLEDKQLFASAIPVANNESSKLTGVGFKGTGKIDDVAVVNLGDGPAFVQPDHTFTIKWETGVTSFKIDNVSYVVADLEAQGKDSVVLTLSGSTTQVTVSDIVLANSDLKVVVRKDGETVAGTEGSYVCSCTEADTTAQLVVQKDNFTINGVATGFDKLQDAFNYIKDNSLSSATITLASDVTITAEGSQWAQAQGILSVNADVVFDLNGNVLSIAENDSNNIPVFQATAGTLTIVDTKGNGKIESPYNPLLATSGTGVIKVGSADAADRGVTIDSIVGSEDSKITICKGFFKDIDYEGYIGEQGDHPTFKDYYAKKKDLGAQIAETTKGGVKYWSVTRAVVGQSSYNITYMDGDSVMTGLTPNTYVYGVGCTLPVDVAKEHCLFNGWLGEDGGLWDEIDVEETDDKVFYAQFTAVPQYPFTVAAIEHTTVSYTYGSETGGAGAVNVYDGDTIRVTYTPDVGYAITDGVATKMYTIAGEAASSTGQVVVAVADYAIAYYDYYDDETHEITGLTPSSYNYGESAVVLPTIDEVTNVYTRAGYTFAGWYESFDDQSGAAVTEIAAGSTGSRVFYAKFVKNGGSGGTGWPAGGDTDPTISTEAVFGLVTEGGTTKFALTVSNASAGYKYRLVGYAALPTSGDPAVAGEWVTVTADGPVALEAPKVNDAAGFYKVQYDTAN